MSHRDPSDGEDGLAALIQAADVQPGRTWPTAVTLGVIVVAVLAGLVYFFAVRGSDPDNDELGSAIASTTTSLAGDPLIDEPGLVVEAGKSGPEPHAVPDAVQQPLEPLTALTLGERDLLEEFDQLAVDSQSAVAKVPFKGSHILSMTGIGTFPGSPREGKLNTCYWIGYPTLASSLVDCLDMSGEDTVVPLWFNVETRGIWAWGGIPPDAAVAVLTERGEDVLWQRPVSGVVAFLHNSGAAENLSIRVLDAEGNTIATSDRTLPPIPEIDETFGNYSGMAPQDVDIKDVMRDMARCITSLGIDTRVLDPGTVIRMATNGNALRAEQIYESCWEALGLPELRE